MKYIALTLAMLTAACGKVKVDGEVKGKLDPVEVKHYIALDTLKLEAYYRSECEVLYTIAADIDACTEQKVSNFLKNFTYTTP